MWPSSVVFERRMLSAGYRYGCSISWNYYQGLTEAHFIHGLNLTGIGWVVTQSRLSHWPSCAMTPQKRKELPCPYFAIRYIALKLLVQETRLCVSHLLSLSVSQSCWSVCSHVLRKYFLWNYWVNKKTNVSSLSVFLLQRKAKCRTRQGKCC